MRKTLTPEQTAKRDARRAQFKALVKQVADMTDVERAALTSRIGAVLTCEGSALSLKNTMLCLLQNSRVSMVGGFRQWLKHGRVVRKGEHGMMIFCPSIRNGAAGETIPSEPKDGESGELFFITGTVFDVTQTDLLDGVTAGDSSGLAIVPAMPAPVIERVTAPAVVVPGNFNREQMTIDV